MSRVRSRALSASDSEIKERFVSLTKPRGEYTQSHMKNFRHLAWETCLREIAEDFSLILEKSFRVFWIDSESKYKSANSQLTLKNGNHLSR